MAELTLGIVGALAATEGAIKAYEKVTATCSALKHAESEIRERSLRLLSNRSHMETQLEIFRRIGDQLDEQVQDVQKHVLEILTQKLEYADVKLKDCVRSSPMNPDLTVAHQQALNKRGKARYAMRKHSLDKAIDEIESWQRLSFNPLWFAILKAQPQDIDKELDCQAKDKDQSQGGKMISATMVVRYPLRDMNATHVFLPPEKLNLAEKADIAFSSVKSVYIDNKWRLVDSGSDLSRETVRQLAVRLRGTDPSTFGLLACLGAVFDNEKNDFSLVFRVPENMSRPETLRARIMAPDSIHSLSDRFRLATQLARAVSSVHTFDMVHKSIRPENIVLLQDRESTLGTAFLFGFERVRRDADATLLRGDADWEKNLYRHPQRQGSSIRDRYIMQHDIYSLGVCLLEIGLWSSFVEYGNPNQGPTRPQVYDFRAENIDDSSRPELIKSRLLSLATNELPQKMGTKYARIIESCLTCLDLGNEDFGDESEFQDDGPTVAIRYIEKILLRLGDISV